MKKSEKSGGTRVSEKQAFKFMDNVEITNSKVAKTNIR
jgi:hypothetical protein